MGTLEEERNRIRTEERTRMAVKIVSNVANQILNELEKSETSEQLSSSSGARSKPQHRNKGESNKGQKFSSKNNQRGSQSLSNLSSTSGSKSTQMNNRVKPKPFPRTFKTPPKASLNAYANALPSAPPSEPPNEPPSAPPSYEESIKHPNTFSNPIYNRPPLLNNPYMIPGYAQNFSTPIYPGPYPSQPVPYTNFTPHRPFFRPPNSAPYSNFAPHRPFLRQPMSAPSLQQTYPVKKNVMSKAAQACSRTPTPTPRESIQNKDGHTNSTSDSKHQKQNSDVKKIDVNIIVRNLSDCEGYYCFLKSLAFKLDMNSSDLLVIIKENEHIFSSLNDCEKRDSIIELCPKIYLCKNHQQSGCTVRDCEKIHLCNDFIDNSCVRKDCPLGHISNFKSNHNINILKKFYMSILPNTTLQKLFQKIWGKTIPQLCYEYYQGKCQVGHKCKNLHICYSYINNLGICYNDDCVFSHEINDAKIASIFDNLGISTNESPRDLIKILKEKCVGKSGTKENKNKKSSKKESRPSSDDKQQTYGKNSEKGNKKEKKDSKKSDGYDSQAENATIHCIDFHGTVKKPKVCLDGMKLNCKFVRNGCHYLHCRHQSHWQFGNSNKWYNFHLYHSQILDTKFSDPSCEDVTLPKLDFSRLKASQKNFIQVFGNGNLQIDFNNMTLFCESAKTTYSVRILTTDSSVLASNKDDIDDFTVFKWYFKDNDGQWKLYDNCDSSSATIEKAYVNSSGYTNFNSASFSYKIDFLKMTQENETTNKVRPLRRRPFIPRIAKTNSETKNKNEEVQLPKTWDEMKTETFKRVKLSTSDNEYIDIRQRLALSLPFINIINIWRIQNIFLWQKFKNKQKALEKQYCDNFLNVQKLFHGIESESVDDIIRENIEFRRHSIDTNRLYGEGTYFYTSASAGANNSTSDVDGKKTLLIAEVILGKVTEGSVGLTRPPENPQYNAMYDSTTDNVQNPSLYVKYSSLEYYPAYVVEFK